MGRNEPERLKKYLAERFSDWVWRRLSAECKIRNITDANIVDDAVQETFRRSFQAIDDGRFTYYGDAATRNYLKRVMHGALWDTIRGRDRLGTTGPLKWDRRDPSEFEDVWDAFPSDDDEGWLRWLSECLDRLPADGKARKAVMLKHGHGWTYKQIAQQLNMSYEGVKTLLYRTRISLRECIENRKRRFGRE